MSTAGKIKVAVASHSLVSERQYWFFDWMEKNYPDLSLLKLAPDKWGVHSVEWGYPVSNAGDLRSYKFSHPALRALEKFEPDIIYVQNEAYCSVSNQLMRMAQRMGSKFMLYVWENLIPYEKGPVTRLLELSDLVVCGNGEAYNLALPYSGAIARCIQVGVNTDVFKPKGGSVEYDVIFQGRMSPEKGYEVLKEAAKGKDWRILWPQPNFGTPYEKIPERYAKAKVLAAPSLDTPQWKEQHSGYASLDALSCGLYVATSDSSSIVEGLKEAPGVAFSRRGDPKSLQFAIEKCLDWSEARLINRKGRSWVRKKYGYKAIGDTLMTYFRTVKS